MLAIAREFAFSETAFVRRCDGDYQLRWFTPTGEVALCGHATLAAAAVLWVHGGVIPGRTIHFDTLSGTLTARRSADGITIELPRMELIATMLPKDTAEALGIDAVACFHTPMRGGIEDWDYLIPLSSETEVRQLAPDDRALAHTRAGVIVTAPADDTQRFDFVSRYFAPFWGIPEDPVTGSAHCALAPSGAGVSSGESCARIKRRSEAVRLKYDWVNRRCSSRGGRRLSCAESCRSSPTPGQTGLLVEHLSKVCDEIDGQRLRRALGKPLVGGYRVSPAAAPIVSTAR